MKTVRILTILIIVLSSLFNGCAYNIKIDPNIEPSANIANPMPLKVGLFIPAETKGLTITDNVQLTKYTFQAGEAVESIITKSTNRAFSHVEVLETYPTQHMIVQRNLDLVIIAKVTSGKASLNWKRGFFQATAEGNVSLSVLLYFYDAKMLQITSVRGSGISIGSEEWGAFSTGEEEYSIPVESAIRNLGDDLVHQIYGNYDIRKISESVMRWKR